MPRPLLGLGSMTGQIIVTNEGTTRIITLRRPGKKNAITQDMYREMGHAIDGDDIDHFLNAVVAPGGAVERSQVPLLPPAQRQADHRGGGRVAIGLGTVLCSIATMCSRRRPRCSLHLTSTWV